MFKPRLIICIALLFAVLAAATPAQAQANKKNDEKTVMGWVEYVYIADIEARLKGKLDTGATTSSMRAEVLKLVRHKKGERRRVIFQIVDNEGKTSTLERRLVRWVRIKSKKTGVYYRRPVVDMEFCVAGQRIHSEVNLAPRTDFIYPILVGRNMLRDADIVVDADRTFTGHAHCPAVTIDDKKED